MSGPHNRGYAVRFSCTPFTKYDYQDGMSITNTVFQIHDAKTLKTMEIGPSFKVASSVCEMMNMLAQELDDVKKLLGLFDIDTQQYPNW